MNEEPKVPQLPTGVDHPLLATRIKQWGNALGFQHIGISDINLDHAGTHLNRWLAAGRHGAMDYMACNVDKRSHPEQLVDGTVRVISARMNYRVDVVDTEHILRQPQLGFVSRYALGRDYHKLLRKRLQKLADRIVDEVDDLGYRVFVDSAPVLEKALAEKAGLGWIGKHTNVLSRNAGSWFFLGEIYIDAPLPVDSPSTNHCGTCQACIDICPTRAIVAPYQLDARLCISYLTIELRGSIPEELRRPMGNRIYGCDDCQLVCPWNRYADLTTETDFLPRHSLDAPQLLALFSWSEEEFLRRTEGSPIRRIGHACWLRNIAVALGNGPKTDNVRRALTEKLNHPSALVREHVAWALAQPNHAPV